MPPSVTVGVSLPPATSASYSSETEFTNSSSVRFSATCQASQRSPSGYARRCIPCLHRRYCNATQGEVVDLTMPLIQELARKITHTRFLVRVLFSPGKLAAVVSLTGLFFASSGWPQAPLRVEWQDTRLSVSADHTPLYQILQKVARQTGLKIQGLEGLQEEVSISFSGLPLPTGLEKLLMSANYILIEKSTPPEDLQPGLLLITGKRGTVVDKSEAAPGGQAIVPGWQSLDPALRLAQVQETGRPALQQGSDILSAAVRDTDPSIRQLAYHRLFDQGEKEQLAELLKQALASADSERRRTALESLGQFFAADATDLLRDATADEHPDVRHTAFQQLSHIDSAEAEQILTERLAHPNAEIRLMAIEAMAARGETVARVAATAVLYDSDELVRSKAAGLLQELGAHEGGAK